MQTTAQQPPVSRSRILIWRLVQVASLLFTILFSVVALLLFTDRENVLAVESKLFGFGFLLIVALCVILINIADKKLALLTRPPPVVLPHDLKLPIIVYARKKRFMVFVPGVLLLAPMAYVLDKEGHWFWALVLSLLVLLILYLILDVLINWNNPEFKLDHQGIYARRYGFIPWSDMQRLSANEHEFRGHKYHALEIVVGNPKKYLRRLPVISRWLRVMNTRHERATLGISLDSLTLSPAYIEAVIKRLQGDYAMSIGVQQITGDMAIDEKLSEADRLMSALNENSSEAEIERTLKKAEKLTEEGMSELKFRQQNSSRNIAVLAVAAVILLLLTTIPVVLRFLGK